jgi:hypothetical protein
LQDQSDHNSLSNRQPAGEHSSVFHPNLVTLMLPTHFSLDEKLDSRTYLMWKFSALMPKAKRTGHSRVPGPILVIPISRLISRMDAPALLAIARKPVSATSFGRYGTGHRLNSHEARFHATNSTP